MNRRPRSTRCARRRGDRGELPRSHERNVCRATLDHDVVAESEGEGGHRVIDRAQVRLGRRVLQVNVLLDGGTHPTGRPGGSVGHRPLAVLGHSVLRAQPTAYGVLVERVDARALHERDPLLERTSRAPRSTT